MRPKGVADGQRVYIPAPPRADMSEGGTPPQAPSPGLVGRVLPEAGEIEKPVSRQLLPGDEPIRKERRSSGSGGQEKPLARHGVTVPQTDTGRRGEDPQACERTLVKELGKLTP